MGEGEEGRGVRVCVCLFGVGGGGLEGWLLSLVSFFLFFFSFLFFFCWNFGVAGNLWQYTFAKSHM